jgi:hypothetical protein
VGGVELRVVIAPVFGTNCCAVSAGAGCAVVDAGAGGAELETNPFLAQDRT